MDKNNTLYELMKPLLNDEDFKIAFHDSFMREVDNFRYSNQSKEENDNDIKDILIDCCDEPFVFDEFGLVEVNEDSWLYSYIASYKSGDNKKDIVEMIITLFINLLYQNESKDIIDATLEDVFEIKRIIEEKYTSVDAFLQEHCYDHGGNNTDIILERLAKYKNIPIIIVNLAKLIIDGKLEFSKEYVDVVKQSNDEIILN